MKRVTITVKLNKVHSLASTIEVVAKDYGDNIVEFVDKKPNRLFTNKIVSGLKIITPKTVLSTRTKNVDMNELIQTFSSIYPVDIGCMHKLRFIDKLNAIHKMDKNITMDNYGKTQQAMNKEWFMGTRNNLLYVIHMSPSIGEDVYSLEDNIATITEINGISNKAVIEQMKKAKLLAKPVSPKTIGVILAASTYVLWRSSDDYDKYAEFIESLDLPSTLTTIPETIYRGLSLSKIAINRLKEGKRIKLRPRALTSWDKAKRRPKFVSQQFSKKLSNAENYKYNESGEKLLKPLSRGTVLLRLDSNNKNKDSKTECLVNLYEVGKQPEAKSLLVDPTNFREIIMRNNGGFKYITREDLV